jgi:hypothetical protein
MRRIATSNGNINQLVGAVILNVALALAIIIVPIKSTYWLFAHHPQNRAIAVAASLLVSCFVNGLDVFLAAFIVVLAGFTLFYRFAYWPAICRTFHALASMTILQRRGLLWGASAACGAIAAKLLGWH